MKIGENFNNMGKIQPMNRHLPEIGGDCLVGAESKILHCPVRCYKEDPRLIINDLKTLVLSLGLYINIFSK